MKIASLVPYKIIPPKNGGQKGIYYFTTYLSEQFEVHCLTVNENKTELPFDIIGILGSGKNKFRYTNIFLFFKIKNYCKKNNIKHIIVEHPYFGWLGVALKKLAGIHFIIHSHNIEGNRFKTMKKWWWRGLFWYEKMVHRYADLSFFVTKEDADFAIDHFKLNSVKTGVIPFGIENKEAPSLEEKNNAKKQLCNDIGVSENTTLLLFNGTLDYLPNQKGLDDILENINPILQKEMNQEYKIIICGLRLPEKYNNLKSYEDQNIIYKGFVEDIYFYFKAVDLFINPIVDGGGIKTKLVEALAGNTTSISYKNGAFGIPKGICDDHLEIVEDRNFKKFTSAIMKKTQEPKTMIPEAFFEFFYWGNIVVKTKEFIAKL